MTNRDGDPAHQARVAIRLPDTLGYTSTLHAESVSKLQTFEALISVAIDPTVRHIENMQGSFILRLQGLFPDFLLHCLCLNNNELRSMHLSSSTY